jgi:hypothetical protein
MTDLIAAIETSRYLLAFGDNWDENGTIGFTELTWKRAAQVLINVVTEVARTQGVTATSTEILPSSAGGLDIDVRLKDRELLISIPADPAKPARFYGDDGRGDVQVKGTLDTSNIPEWLSMWMAG